MSPENRNLALIEDDPIMGESMARRLELEGARAGVGCRNWAGCLRPTTASL